MLDPDGEYLTSAWRNHVYPLAANMNMDLQQPRIQPRSRLAHEAAKWAGSKDRLYAYSLALFKAFFSDGLDIGKSDVLAQLADGLDLDPQDLLAALAENRFAEAVRGDQAEARRIGVNAVPAFAAHGRILAAGVQTAARLRSLLKSPPLAEQHLFTMNK